MYCVTLTARWLVELEVIAFSVVEGSNAAPVVLRYSRRELDTLALQVPASKGYVLADRIAKALGTTLAELFAGARAKTSRIR